MTLRSPVAAPIPVIVNPHAGVTGTSASTIQELLEGSGLPFELEEVVGDVRAPIERAMARGAPLVAVAGGDGTMLAAAQVLAGSATALAPIPSGTLNHLARRVGIATPEEALRAIAAGRQALIPLGVVDDQLFLNTATFGVYADVVRGRERHRRWLGKWPAAAVSFAIRFVRLRQVELVIDTGEGPTIIRSPLLWIGMGRGSFPLVHEAPRRFAPPELEVVMISAASRLAVLRTLAHVWRMARASNPPAARPGIIMSHTRSLLLGSDHDPIGVTLDGEVHRLAPPVFVGLAGQALRVIIGIPADPGSDPADSNRLRGDRAPTDDHS